MCEWLCRIYRIHFTDQDLGIFRNLKTCQLCDSSCFLTYNLRIYRAIFIQNNLPHLVEFGLIQHMTATLDKFRTYLIINICNGSYRLFGCTDHTIIKGLGMDYRIDCRRNITAAVHDNRCISRSHADGRMSGRIGCSHHARTTGCQNHIHRFHQKP